jgi:hypothetical protein
MDKGYDSEAIHSLTREQLHAVAMIPLRQRRRKRIRGYYRRKMIWVLMKNSIIEETWLKQHSQSLKENMEKKSSPGSTGIS